MAHTRIRPFNTKDTYPEQSLDNDLAQAVVASGRTVREVPWPVADLRVDWTEDCPIAGLAAVWEIYKPQLDDYVIRAFDPSAAPSYRVPGDV